jgi:preprotein translocase subunit SecA
VFGIRAGVTPEDLGEEAFDSLTPEELTRIIKEQALESFARKEEQLGREEMENLQRMVMLQIIDTQWVSHLQDMEHMKGGIGLRGYGQMDPLKEYQKEGFALFEELTDRIREETLSTLARIQFRRPAVEPPRQKRALNLNRGDGDGKPATVRRSVKKVGRNDPCPCGSGKKYKKCCGRNK